MRLFNQKIWTGTACNTEVFTDADLNALLGSADMFAIHAHITRPTATSKLKVNFYHSADNKNWIAGAATAYTSPTGFTAGTVNDVLVLTEALSGTNARLGFVRIGILMDTSGHEADVELYATGRGF